MNRADRIAFKHLSDVPAPVLVTHLNDPVVLEHMPLSTKPWNEESILRWVAAKERQWADNGLGPWAFFIDGGYAGWGGFQLEGDEWDIGVVLTRDRFGWGPAIVGKLLEFAKADPRIEFVTFLLPPSRTNLSGLKRLGAAARR